MQALIFGSIGTLAETSNLQREAFNASFTAHGLDWHWDIDTYRVLLVASGGQNRISRFAQERGESVDAAAIHALKSQIFQESLNRGVPLRPGVADTLTHAEARGWQIALATSTSAENVDAILAATGLCRGRLDIIVDASHALPPKPKPDVFHAALAAMGMSPQDAFAIEDNPDGFRAARAAGLACVAFPGLLHEGADFAEAIARQTNLDLTSDMLQVD